MRVLRIVAQAVLLATATHAATIYDCYAPVKGAWEIQLTGDKCAPRGDPSKMIGVVSANAACSGDPRLHRRPLFSGCERALLFSPKELIKLERVPFRPIVLAYNEPRFLLDFHSAGG
jgi:hypothetical protein